MYLFSLRELNFENTGAWPTFLKYLCVVIFVLILVGMGYWIVIIPHVNEYEVLLYQEKLLTTQFVAQQWQAAQLPAAQQQLLMMQQRFDHNMQMILSKQNEMPSLLANISKTGVNSGLIFALFAPLAEVAHDFYIEVPINLVVIGNYQQFAAFFHHLAKMHRMVTVHDFAISPYKSESHSVDVSHVLKWSTKRSDLLTMTLTVKVYWARKVGGMQK